MRYVTGSLSDWQAWESGSVVVVDEDETEVTIKFAFRCEADLILEGATEQTFTAPMLLGIHLPGNGDTDIEVSVPSPYYLRARATEAVTIWSKSKVSTQVAVPADEPTFASVEQRSSQNNELARVLKAMKANEHDRQKAFERERKKLLAKMDGLAAKVANVDKRKDKTDASSKAGTASDD